MHTQLKNNTTKQINTNSQLLTKKEQLNKLIITGSGKPDFLAINLYYDTLRSWYTPKKTLGKDGTLKSSVRLYTKGIFISYRKLQEIYGYSSQTLQRKLAKLEKLGLIRRSFQHKRIGDTNCYNQLIIYVWKNTPLFFNEYGIDHNEVNRLVPQTNHRYISKKYASTDSTNKQKETISALTQSLPKLNSPYSNKLPIEHTKNLPNINNNKTSLERANFLDKNKIRFFSDYFSNKSIPEESIKDNEKEKSFTIPKQLKEFFPLSPGLVSAVGNKLNSPIKAEVMNQFLLEAVNKFNSRASFFNESSFVNYMVKLCCNKQQKQVLEGKALKEVLEGKTLKGGQGKDDSNLDRDFGIKYLQDFYPLSTQLYERFQLFHSDELVSYEAINQLLVKRLKENDKQAEFYSEVSFINYLAKLCSTERARSGARAARIATSKKEGTKQKKIAAINSKKNILFEQAKTLSEFYPLSSADCDYLRARAGKNYTDNAMNEILQDMGRRIGKDNLFRSQISFFNYMSKTFEREMRDPDKIGGVNFKIKANYSDSFYQMSLAASRYLNRFERSTSFKTPRNSKDLLKKELVLALEELPAYLLVKDLDKIERSGNKLVISLADQIADAVPIIENIDKNHLVEIVNNVYRAQALQKKGHQPEAAESAELTEVELRYKKVALEEKGYSASKVLRGLDDRSQEGKDLSLKDRLRRNYLRLFEENHLDSLCLDKFNLRDMVVEEIEEERKYSSPISPEPGKSLVIYASGLCQREEIVNAESYLLRAARKEGYRRLIISEELIANN